MSNALELRPTYWASISGGKDSLDNIIKTKWLQKLNEKEQEYIESQGN